MNYKKLIGAGTASIGFILFSFLVLPLFQVLADTREAIQSKQDILDQRKDILAKIADLKKKIDSRKTEIGQLASVLPTEKKTQEIVVNIEDMANQSGIELRDLKTAEIISLERNKGYQVLQVELSGSGSYQSFIGLIKLLEKNLRIFDVQGFTVSLDASGIPGKLNLDLKLFTYFLSKETQ